MKISLVIFVMIFIISSNALNDNRLSSLNYKITKLYQSKGFGTKPSIVDSNSNTPAVEAIKLTRKTDTRQVMVLLIIITIIFTTITIIFIYYHYNYIIIMIITII